MKRPVRILMMFIGIGVAPIMAEAADLGTYGPTFTISEDDLLKQILGKLKAAEADGKIEGLNRRFAESTRQRVENPTPVSGIATTRLPRTWLYDPSIIVPQDYADDKGRVFARKGEKINPLDRLPGFNKVMVFIDGRDERQVAFAVAQSKTYGRERTVLILVNGSPMAVMRAHKQAFYFDQLGTITSKFGITQVPATVARDGNLLRVREVRP